MNMAQNNLQGVPVRQRPDGGGVESTRGNRVFAPGVDIYETESELLLFADLPGVNPKDIDLRYERGELTLTAKAAQRERPGRLLAAEFEDGDYYRVFRVNETIDATHIDAEYKQGVLLVHLPKQEQAKPKQVRVRGQ
jgi:HSP20 family protein